MKRKVAVLCTLLGIVSARAQTGAPATGTPDSKTPFVGIQTPPATAPAQSDSAATAFTNTAVGMRPGATNNAVSPSVAPSGAAPIISVPANPAEPMRDQALNPTDANLLREIRQSVFQPGQAGAESVFFVLMNGALRLTGNVPTAEEQKRIDAAVSRIPGITKVYDALTVAAATTAQTPSTAVPTNVAPTLSTGAPAPTNALPPTGRPDVPGQTNTNGTP